MAFRRRTILGGAVLAALTALYLLVSVFRTAPTTIHDTHEDFDEYAELGSAPNRSTKRILLVSALYPLEKSKHSQEEYRDWLHHFLGQISTDIYFFTPPALEDLVLQTRAEGLYLKVNTTYPSAFSIPPLAGREEAYEEMHRNKDRERARHNPELYAIWNAKPFFLDEAVREMRDTWGREYDYAFWVDAGSFRGEHAYEQWPEPGRVEAVFDQGNSTDSIFIPLYDLPRYKYRWWKEDMGPVDDEVSEGSFFGGSPKAIEWYSSTFYIYHDYYLSLGYFVGKDQTIINSLLLLFPHRFITALQQRDPIVYSQKFRSGRCGPYWYYYEFLLSNPVERWAMERMWEERRVPGTWSNILDWVVGRGGRCPLVDGVSVERALSQGFGFDWKTEKPTVVPA